MTQTVLSKLAWHAALFHEAAEGNQPSFTVADRDKAIAYLIQIVLEHSQLITGLTDENRRLRGEMARLKRDVHGDPDDAQVVMAEAVRIARGDYR